MQNANYRKMHHRLEYSQWIILHCTEDTCPQTVLRQRHWNLLPIFRASTGVSSASGTAKASLQVSVHQAVLQAKSGSKYSTTLIKFVTLMSIRHQGSCYRLPSHLGSASTCQFTLSRYVTPDWNSKCSWHRERYFHYKAHTLQCLQH